MARGDDDGIKPLDPPVIALATLLAQRHLPLGADLLGQLDGGAVRHKVLVAAAVDQPLDVPAHDVPVAEGSLVAVQGDGALRALSGDGLLGELHGHVLDVGLQVRVDGRLCEPRLVALGSQRRELRGDGHRLVGGALGQCCEVCLCRGSLRVSEPVSSCQKSTTAPGVARTGQRGLFLPASSRRLPALKHTDEIKRLLLGQGIDGDGSRGASADDGYALHRCSRHDGV